MLDRRSTQILDGDLLSALSRRGLPDVKRNAPVAEWLREHPEAVKLAYERFVEAGAQILTASTRGALPSLDADWGDLADRAVAIARSAAGDRPVWAAIGPGSTPERAWADATFDERQAHMQGWSQLAKRCAAAGVSGFTLEAFTDTTECSIAIMEVHASAPELTIAASLFPRDDGLLLDGSDPVDALRVLRKAGATWAGFSGGSGPPAIEAAVARAPEADWARPSSGGHPAEAVAESLIRLIGKCWRVGGWSGVKPQMIAEFSRRNALSVQPPRNALLDVSESAP